MYVCEKEKICDIENYAGTNKYGMQIRLHWIQMHFMQFDIALSRK